jgi:hypothetical protein
MHVIVRIGEKIFAQLRPLVFSRYPDLEWATFALSGWSETENGLVISIAQLIEPGPGDLNVNVRHAQFMEPYTLRAALEVEPTPLVMTVIHSHPESYQPLPSRVDDDMDTYYSDYFSGFAPNRPYASLIFSTRDDQLLAGGRVFWQGRWHRVDNFKIEGVPTTTIGGTKSEVRKPIRKEGTRRLVDAFGDEAAERLAGATVAAIGASGTGSVAIEIFARAGVGHLLIVDPESFAESNLERLHGSTMEDVARSPLKVEIAKRHIHSINPSARITAIVGRLPQRMVLEHLMQADVVLGCTDSNAARVALSDLAWRYGVPTFDVGVLLEGGEGNVSGLIGNIVQFGPGRPCAMCQGMYHAGRVTQELMSKEEKEQRKAAAARAKQVGADSDGYWKEYPQLNTVGFLTSTAASIAAGYAIGLITERFKPPFQRVQFNLVQSDLGAVDHFPGADLDCPCQKRNSWGDCAIADAIVTPPKHWSPPRIV